LDPRPSSHATTRPPLDLEPPATPLSPGDYLRRRILLGGFAVPSWLLSAGVALVSAIATASLGTVLIAASDEAPLTLAQSFGAVIDGSASVEVPLVELAATGEPEAMKQLESKPAKDRTVDELVALTRGRAMQRKEALGLLADDLKRNPNLGEDPDVLRRLREATQEPELAPEALRILATLPGPTAIDVIYDTWTGTKDRTETTQLAQDLVLTRSVREKASPALAVALDLRDTQQCEEVSKIVDRAIEHGDRRSLRPLGKLTLRFGCGPRKSEDCFPCLRGDHRVTDAISAVLGRPKPKL
jgi:hypothetical protein